MPPQPRRAPRRTCKSAPHRPWCKRSRRADEERAGAHAGQRSELWPLAQRREKVTAPHQAGECRAEVVRIPTRDLVTSLAVERHDDAVASCSRKDEPLCVDARGPERLVLLLDEA